MPYARDTCLQKKRKPEQSKLFGLLNLAEAMRFELMSPFEPPVFKTGAFNRSATPPENDFRIVLKRLDFFKSSREELEDQGVISCGSPCCGRRAASFG